MNKPQLKGRPGKPRNGDGHLPRWLTVSIVAAFAAFTIIHIVVDIAVATYDGGTTSLMLGGIVGAALAGDRINANRSGDGDA